MHFIRLRHTSFPLALLFGLLVQGTVPLFAQAQTDDIDARITKLNGNIGFSVKQGTIEQEQASKLRAELRDVRMQAAGLRQNSGGKLKPKDLAGLESKLNQQANIIHSYNQAGSRKAVSQRAIGPSWIAGQDGAQNVNKLKRQMKIQERRQLHQEEQAILQVKEQQQQQYEKEMLQKLGSQRPAILKNKEDIDQIRQTSGAN